MDGDSLPLRCTHTGMRICYISFLHMHMHMPRKLRASVGFGRFPGYTFSTSADTIIVKQISISPMCLRKALRIVPTQEIHRRAELS